MPSHREEFTEMQGVMFIRPEVFGTGNTHAETRAVAQNVWGQAITKKVNVEWVLHKRKNKTREGFPDGPAVKKPLCNAKDTGSIPGLGRSHMPWGSWAHVPQLMSPPSRAHEPQLLQPARLEPRLRNERSHCNIVK